MRNDATMRLGHPWMLATVDDIDTETMVVVVKDSYGKSRTLPLGVRWGNGPLPRVGETWVLSSFLGGWSFTACIDPRPPVVEGSTAEEVLKNLLAALDGAGVIDDQTSLP